MATKTLSKDEILDAIGNMTVIELADMVEAFKEKFNVTVAAAPVAAAPGATGGDAAGEAEEKTEFTVVLKDMTSLGLKEAKELVDSAPSNVKEDISKDEAESIKQKLEEQGATVELK